MTAILVSVFLLLLLSAFFSGSETGLTSVSRAKIQRLKSEGVSRAIMVNNLRKDKDRLIGTILLGNNAVNIASSALATSVAISYFGDEGVVYATLIMTLLILIFAEVLPKTYAFSNAERVALFVAPVFAVLVRVFHPLTKLIQILVNLMMKIFRIKSTEDDSTYGVEFLRGAIELHHDEGEEKTDDRYMLGSILDLVEIEVEEIMIHRKEMEIINAELPIEEIIERVMASQFSRIPMWKENPDNIIGILYIRDIVGLIHNANLDNANLDNANIETILKEPWFIPSTTHLKDQLQAFRDRHSHFALVVDEYGDLLGLITLEDIIEEIVGQISDEYDVHETNISKQDDDSYIVEGGTSIRDINRELDWKIPDEAATVAGLVINNAQLIPEVGQVFHFYDYRFEVLEKSSNQITSIKVSKFEEKASKE